MVNSDFKMTSKSNLPPKKIKYNGTFAFCENCGVLTGNEGCNSVWHCQESIRIDDEDAETDEEKFLRELEEEDQADWEQSQKEWEQEEWEEEQGEIWEEGREEMDRTITQENHTQCCLEILARFRAMEYYPGVYLPEFNPHTDTTNYRLN